MDNVLVLTKVIHYFKCRTKGRGEVALKIDISKAYDHANCGFLEAMMAKMCFSLQWMDGSTCALNQWLFQS